MENRRNCEHCGGPMPRLCRSHARFCSNRCRVGRHRALRKSPVPIEMREADRWVRHTRKRPITCSGAPASSTASGTWASYAAATRSKVGDGIGFALGAGFACIDLDDCIVRGRLTERAQAIVDALPGAYIEISPSGRGLHIFGLATERPGITRKGYEVYSRGRYVTVTGRVWQRGALVPLGQFFV